MTKEYQTFENAEELWFWFCRSLILRRAGLRGKTSEYYGSARICEIADIERLLRRLKISGVITNRHLRVMCKWGKLERAPYYDIRAKRSEIRLWEEGMNMLDYASRLKGIIQ